MQTYSECRQTVLQYDTKRDGIQRAWFESFLSPEVFQINKVLHTPAALTHYLCLVLQGTKAVSSITLFIVLLSEPRSRLCKVLQFNSYRCSQYNIKAVP